MGSWNEAVPNLKHYKQNTIPTANTNGRTYCSELQELHTTLRVLSGHHVISSVAAARALFVTCRMVRGMYNIAFRFNTGTNTIHSKPSCALQVKALRLFL